MICKNFIWKVATMVVYAMMIGALTACNEKEDDGGPSVTGSASIAELTLLVEQLTEQVEVLNTRITTIENTTIVNCSHSTCVPKILKAQKNTDGSSLIHSFSYDDDGRISSIIITEDDDYINKCSFQYMEDAIVMRKQLYNGGVTTLRITLPKEDMSDPNVVNAAIYMKGAM